MKKGKVGWRWEVCTHISAEKPPDSDYYQVWEG